MPWSVRCAWVQRQLQSTLAPNPTSSAPTACPGGLWGDHSSTIPWSYIQALTVRRLQSWPTERHGGPGLLRLTEENFTLWFLELGQTAPLCREDGGGGEEAERQEERSWHWPRPRCWGSEMQCGRWRSCSGAQIYQEYESGLRNIENTSPWAIEHHGYDTNSFSVLWYLVTTLEAKRLNSIFLIISTD